MRRNKLIRQMAEHPFEEELEAIYARIHKREDELREMNDADFAKEVTAYAEFLKARVDPAEAMRAKFEGLEAALKSRRIQTPNDEYELGWNRGLEVAALLIAALKGETDPAEAK